MKTITLWGEEIVERKICSICGEDKPYNEYSAKPDRRDKLDIRCKSCINLQIKLRKKLRQDAGPPPEVCEMCGKKSRFNLLVDHCHETDKFRGYICKSCNNALGLLGDNLEGVMKAVRYLEL